MAERFDRDFPEVADRVIFIPKLPYDKFLGLLTLADVILDIPTFSGGNSSLEAFSMGVPIVTWPGKFLRGRLTAACYEQMGLNEFIATDAESYIKLVLRLARDHDFKRNMKDAIQANADKLFEREEAVREIESFFVAAHEAWRNGDALKKSSFSLRPGTTAPS